MRQHAQRKRARGRGPARWAAFTIVVGVLAGLLVELATAPGYAIRGAEIDGPAELADSARACVPIGANAYLTRMGRLERTIARDLRVEEAHAQRTGGGILRISLRPRTAEAQIPLEDGDFGLVDSRGLVFDERPSRDSATLIGGMERDGAVVGSRIDPACMGTVRDVRREASRQRLDPVAEVSFETDGRVHAVLAGGTELRLGPPEAIRDKIAVAAGAVRSAPAATIGYVDVELLQHIVMAPRSR